jgi:hypothetical protein
MIAARKAMVAGCDNFFSGDQHRAHHGIGAGPAGRFCS